jgi:hypothetical protein
MNINKESFGNKWLILPVVLILGLATVYAVRQYQKPDAITSSDATTSAPAEAPTKAGEEKPSEADKPVVTRTVVIPAGMVIRGSLSESLSTDATVTGEEFSLRVASPIVIEGVTVVPSGRRVLGRVAESRRAGRVKGRARMVLSFHTLQTPSGEYDISARSVTRVAPETKKRDAAVIGAGAGIGAAIGAITGGGKGAAIGAGVGGGAGTGVVLSTRGKPTGFREGETISVRLVKPVSVAVSS